MPISSPESSIIRFALANTFRVKLVHVVEACLGRTSVRLAVLGAVVVMRSFCSCTCVVLVGFALLLSSSFYVVRPQLCSPAALDVPHACRPAAVRRSHAGFHSSRCGQSEASRGKAVRAGR